MDRLLSYPRVDESEISGSFISGHDYDSDVDYHNDHYGGHDGNDDKCCPLVVDPLCLLAILAAIAGAAVLLQRVLQVELCMVDGNPVTLFVAECRVRRKRSAFGRLRWGATLQRLSEGKRFQQCHISFRKSNSN